MKKRLIAAVFAAALTALCRADGVAVGDTWTTNNLVYKVSQKADESLYLTLTGSVTTNEVIVPSTVTSNDLTLAVLAVANDAFKNKTAITNIVLADGIEFVGTNAFYGCTGLCSVSLGSGLVSIAPSAFYNCRALGEVVLPDSVTNVGYSAFLMCDGVTNFVIGSGLKRIESVGSGTYPKNAAMHLTINGDGETVIADGAFSSSKIRSVTLRGVKYIGNENLGSNGAFNRCESLESVDFGEGLVQIGKMSFYYCKSLGFVSLPDSLERIGENAFNSCTAATNIAFGSGVRQIDNSAFYSCSCLTDVELPASVTNVALSVFSQCTSLTNYTLHAAGRRIGRGFPCNLSNLKTIRIVGDGNVTIAPQAFQTSYTSDKVRADVVELVGVMAIESAAGSSYGAFYGSEIGGVTMDSAMLDIGDYAFYNGKMGSVVMPDSVTNIGNSAFCNCYSLSNLVIGSGVKTIGPSAFVWCRSLGELSIPDSVTNIGASAFSQCNGVTNLVVGSGIAYIQSGAMPKSGLVSLVVRGNGETVIGDNAFRDATSLRSVSLQGVKYIGDPENHWGTGAFYGCTALESVDFGDDIVQVAAMSFYQCKSLQSVSLPASVRFIGGSAFALCTNLGEVVLGEGLETIEGGAFTQAKISAITIPGTVTNMQRYAFSTCADLRSVVFGEGLKSVSPYAFEGLNIESVTIPGSVTNIGEYAFKDAKNLRRVYLADGLQSIGRQAFSGCKLLQYVEIPSTVNKIEYNAFETVSHSAILYFQGPPPEGIRDIGLPRGTTSVRPAAYAAAWASVSVPYYVKVIPEPSEVAPDPRDWSLVEGVEAHSGVIAADETWTADKIHVISGWVTVTNGVTVTVESGALVKFCPGQGLFVKSGGRFIAGGVTLTHISDDTVGGDTDGDSGQIKPGAGDYTIMGWPEEDDETVWRCRLFYVDGELPADEVWTGGGNVYYVTDSLTVPKKVTLTVKQGAIVKIVKDDSLPTPVNLNVNGRLVVAGTRHEPVYFTSECDDSVGGDNNGDGEETNPGRGDWDFVKIAGEATMEHAVLRYGGGHRNAGSRAVIHCTGSGSARLSCCEISEVYWRAVYVEGNTAQFTAENSVVKSVRQSALQSDNGSSLFVNCLFTDCASIAGVASFKDKPTFRNCIFTGLDTWIDGNASSENVVFSHCCFWNRRDGSDACDMAGTDGNFYADPRIPYLEDGDYRIADASPCVDAGDASAPLRDFYGYPRQNVKTAPTGERNADGRYADIGIHEVIPISGVTDAPDLEVFDFTVPESLTAGESVTVGYSVCNVSDEDILGTARFDRIEVVDANGSAVEVFRQARPATPIKRRRGTVLKETATFTVPSFAPGKVTVRVTVNCERDIFEGLLYENNTATSAPLELNVPEVTVSDFLAHGSYTLPAHGSYACHLGGVQSDERLILIRGADDSSLSARTATDGLPTAAAFATKSIALGGGEHLLVLPEGEVSLVIDNEGGTVAMLYVQSVGQGFVLYDSGEHVQAVNTNFLYRETTRYERGVKKKYREIAVSAADSPYNTPKGLYLYAAPNRYVGVDTNGTRLVQMRIWGNQFAAGMTAELVCGGNRIAASDVRVNSANSASLEFDVSGCEPGLYNLVVAVDAANKSVSGKLTLWEPIDYYLNGDDELRLLPGDKEMVDASISKFPQNLRGGRVYNGGVSWRNTAAADLPAPYLRLVADSCHIRLNESSAWGTQIDFIGLSASEDYDMIKPKETRTLNFQMVTPGEDGYAEVPISSNARQTGLQANAEPSEWQSSRGVQRSGDRHGVRVQTLPGQPRGAAAADGTEPYPWDTNEEHSRPPDASDELWAILYPQLRSLYGETWGTYVARLRQRAAAIAACLEKPPVAMPVEDIVQADISRILSDDPVKSKLCAKVDLNRGGRGASLLLARTYSTGLKARFADGLFGRGWHSSLEQRLERVGDSKVLIGIPGGDKTMFTKANGGFWENATAPGTSWLVGYRQVFRDGSYIEFDADGRLAARGDSYGNGITLAHDANGRISRVSHTEGTYMTFAYDGDSPFVGAVTDNAGNRVEYTYEVRDGVYLLASATTMNGSVVEAYQYRQADATAASLALSRRQNTGKASVEYAWNANGRITQVVVGGQFVTEYVRDGDDTVTIISPNGDTKTIVLTPRGEVASVTAANGQTKRYVYADGASGPVAIITASGKRIGITYNSQGDIIEVDSPSGKTTKYTYDDNGKVTQIAGPTGVRKLVYDEHGRVTDERTPSGVQFSTSYNENGSVAEKRLGSGGKGWSCGYGASGQLGSLTSLDATMSYAYARSPNGSVTRATVVKDGVAGPATDISYDEEGQVSQVVSGTHSVSYAYAGGAVGYSQVVNAEGVGEKYVYDAFGRLSQVVDAQDESNVYVTKEYNDGPGGDGSLLRETFGDGMVKTYSYADGHLVSVETTRPTAVGLRATRGGGPAVAISHLHIDYDVDGKAVRASDSVRGEQKTYTYDADGNVVCITTTNGEGTEERTGERPEGDAVTTDPASGNITKIETQANGTWVCEYDAFNNLVSLVNEEKGIVWRAEYDAFGNCVKTVKNGKNVERVVQPHSGKVIDVYVGGGESIHYIWAGGQKIGRRRSNGEVEFFVDGEDLEDESEILPEEFPEEYKDECGINRPTTPGKQEKEETEDELGLPMGVGSSTTEANSESDDGKPAQTQVTEQEDNNDGPNTADLRDESNDEKFKTSDPLNGPLENDEAKEKKQKEDAEAEAKEKEYKERMEAARNRPPKNYPHYPPPKPKEYKGPCQ